MVAFDENLLTLIRLSREGHLCVKKSQLPCPLSSSSAIVQDGDRIYLQKNWVYETTILKNLRRLKASEPTKLFDRSLFQKHLEHEAKLLPEQKEALQKAFVEPLFVLSGGPGTGKTYTAVTFVRLLLGSLIENETLHLCIAAPTGKAATHLQQILVSQNPSFRCEATTLHRLLKLQPGENRLFSKNRRIDADLILVDEASMIDVPLLAHLLEAVGNGSRLILMGDPDQLPPVEQGSLFAELSTLFGVSLKRCMRTEETTLAEAVRRGEIKSFENFRLDWAFDNTLSQKLFERIQPIHSKEKPDPQKCLDHYNSLRILNALRQGPFGTAELNRQIAHKLEAQADPWRALPILITANDPHSKLYNGMTGVLIQKSGLREAYFPDRSDPMFYLPPYEVAFCLSIHKSQGSEFDEVIALFPMGSDKFGRESLYTAVTRAKKRFQWVGEKEVLRNMASRFTERTSGLIERFSFEVVDDKERK